MPIPTRLMLSLTLLALLSGCVSSSGTRAKSGSDGWKTLFDGKTFAGWRGYRMKAMPAKGWKIEDGILKKVGGEHGGDIITEETFDNFELNWEWRISKGGNNGIKYLVTEDRPSAPGPEYQMIDDKANEDGKLGPKHASASFYDVLPPASDEPLKPAGAWNQSRVLIQSAHVEHWLNGKKVLEYELGSDAVKAAVAKSKFRNARGFGEKIKGHILLTDHHDECWFRNIRIRELPMASVRGAVRQADTYDYQPGVTLTKMIALAGGLTEFAHWKVQNHEADGKTIVFDVDKPTKRPKDDPVLEPDDLVWVADRN